MEKTGDNPHWESDSIDNKCVTKLAVVPSRPASGQHVIPETLTNVVTIYRDYRCQDDVN